MPPRFAVTGTFGDEPAAIRAKGALLAAGVSPADVTIDRRDGTAAAEAPFLWRVVVAIVLWSIAGGVVGALIGLAIAQTGIGPGGTGGLVLQLVSWLIFGHLIAGMWAGYALLADRSSPEFAPPPSGRAASLVTVLCSDRAQIERARGVMRDHRAMAVRESVADEANP